MVRYWTEEEIERCVESMIGSCQSIGVLARQWLESQELEAPIDVELDCLLDSYRFKTMFDSLAFVCDGCGWIVEIGDESSEFASVLLCSDCARDYGPEYS